MGPRASEDPNHGPIQPLNTHHNSQSGLNRVSFITCLKYLASFLLSISTLTYLLRNRKIYICRTKEPETKSMTVAGDSDILNSIILFYRWNECNLANTYRTKQLSLVRLFSVGKAPRIFQQEKLLLLDKTIKQHFFSCLVVSNLVN